MLRTLYAFRTARIAAGVAGTFLGFACFVGEVFMNHSIARGVIYFSAWPLAMIIATVAFAHGWFSSARDHSIETQFDIAGRAYAMEIRSIAWPLTALAILIPMSLSIAKFEVAIFTIPVQIALIYFSRQVSRGVPDLSRYSVKALAVITACAMLALPLKAAWIPIATTSVLFVGLWCCARLLIDRERKQIASSTACDESPERMRSIILDERRDENARIMALYTLARSRARLRVLPILDDALRCSDAVSAAALDLAHHMRHRPPADRLLPMLKHPSRRTVVVACEVAAMVRDPALEKPLVKLLGEAVKKDDTQIAVMAIRALSGCGTIACVEVLWTARRIPMISSSVKDAAEAAMDCIQARDAPQSDGGELSLASTQTASGAVSFASGESGALSHARSTSKGVS